MGSRSPWLGARFLPSLQYQYTAIILAWWHMHLILRISHLIFTQMQIFTHGVRTRVSVIVRIRVLDRVRLTWFRFMRPIRCHFPKLSDPILPSRLRLSDPNTPPFTSFYYELSWSAADIRGLFDLLRPCLYHYSTMVRCNCTLFCYLSQITHHSPHFHLIFTRIQVFRHGIIVLVGVRS